MNDDPTIRLPSSLPKRLLVVGTLVRLRRSIASGPNKDHPRIDHCRAGELGKVVGNGGFWDYSVCTLAYPRYSFGVMASEVEVIAEYPLVPIRVPSIGLPLPFDPTPSLIPVSVLGF
jgi:hypothetical protein